VLPHGRNQAKLVKLVTTLTKEPHGNPAKTPMDAKLVVVGSQITPKEIKLQLPVIIGRGRQATLVLPHPLVSRRHCEIVEHQGFLLVRDLGSLNGTFVDQHRIEQKILPPGGLLTLGTITFRAVYEVAGADSPPIGAAESGISSSSGQDSEGLPDTEDLADLAPDDERSKDIEPFMRESE
jgi:pSer/pThr/pTyr-binding forkhead associated (FHA) protein